MKEYLEEASDVLKGLGTTEEGLSALDAQSRLEKHGKNKLDEKKKKSPLMAFLEKLADPMLIILMKPPLPNPPGTNCVPPSPRPCCWPSAWWVTTSV